MAVRMSSTWAQGRVSVKLQREGQQQVPGAQMAAVPPLPAYKSWAFLPANERALHTGLRMFYIDATGAHCAARLPAGPLPGQRCNPVGKPQRLL